MNYENQPCPGCGHHMHEEDDIVVCPVCATPQHRSCWLENGKCVNEDKHTDGYEWKPSELFVEESKPQIVKCHICGSENIAGVDNCMSCGAVLNKATTVYQSNSRDTSRVCRSCGTENDGDAIHCKQCGMPLAGAPQYDSSQNPYINQTGMSPNEPIGEYTADDFSLYTKTTSRRYVPIFKKIEDGRNTGFNIWVFLFAPYWFFYKKIYKAGSAVILLFSAVSIVFASGIEKCQDILLPYQDQLTAGTIEQDQMTELLRQMLNRSGKIFLVALILNVLLRVVCAFMADKLYYKKIVSDLKVISERVTEENFRKVVISKRGGNSVFGIVTAYCLSECIISLMTYAADWISKMF